MNTYSSFSARASPKLDTIANPRCYLLFSGPGIEGTQLVDPDPVAPRMCGRSPTETRTPSGPTARHPNPGRRMREFAVGLPADGVALHTAGVGGGFEYPAFGSFFA